MQTIMAYNLIYYPCVYIKKTLALVLKVQRLKYHILELKFVLAKFDINV